jgi:hypothetical protein
MFSSVLCQLTVVRFVLVHREVRGLENSALKKESGIDGERN